MADGIFRLGGVQELATVEARAGVFDDDGDFLRVDAIGDGDDKIDVLLVPPFDGVPAHLADGGDQLPNLVLGHAAEEEQRAEQVIELVEIFRVALQLEMNLPFRAAVL